MLQFIRSKVTSIFAKILFVLLIASFAVWGIGDTIFGNPAGRAAIEVDDVRITAVEAASEFDRARQRLGIPITVDQAIGLGLLEQTLDNLTVESLLVAATGRLGLSASDEQVVTAIRAQFRDSLGQFDRIAYETFLASQGWTEEDFVARSRRELARNQLIGAVATAAPTSVADGVVRTLHAYREERRIADVVRISADSMPAPTLPDDAALTAYYEERKDSYETPEYRGISWLEISVAALAQEIEFGEDELRAAFEERGDSFSTQGSRTVDQILFESEESARAAADRIRGGEDFAAVAEELTGLDEASLDLGTVSRDGLPDGTASGVFAVTEPGGVTEPLQSDFGWHLFRIRAAEVGNPAVFDEVREALRQELALEQAYDVVFERSNEVEDLLAGGSTLEEASRQLSLPLNQIPLVARDGSQPDGGMAVTLPGDPFLRTAFETEAGEQSTLGETRDGTFFILRVDGVEAPRIPDMVEIRDLVIADWIAEQRLDAAETLADGIVARVDEGIGFSKAAADAGLEILTLTPTTRRGQGLTPGFPPAVAGALFDLQTGEASAVSSNDGAIVVVLTEVIEGGGDMAPADDGLREELAGALSSDIIELLIADLRTRHNVTVDANAVRQLFTLAEGQQMQ
jgi:peptidyl-prolyl cis-trans isomerase D